MFYSIFFHNNIWQNKKKSLLLHPLWERRRRLRRRQRRRIRLRRRIDRLFFLKNLVIIKKVFTFVALSHKKSGLRKKAVRFHWVGIFNWQQHWDKTKKEVLRNNEEDIVVSKAIFEMRIQNKTKYKRDEIKFSNRQKIILAREIKKTKAAPNLSVPKRKMTNEYIYTWRKIN
jgi:ABC-type uncharacterized transport system ATPase subunit